MCLRQHTTNKIAEHGGAYLGARPLLEAFRVGLAAYRAGEDVVAAVTLAGFSAKIARATYNKITRQGSEEQEEEAATTTTSTNEMNKRLKTSSTFYRRRSGPVAPTVKKYVKRCMDRVVEQKYFAVNTGNIASTTGGTVTSLGSFSIVQGTGDNQRTGNNIRISDLTFRGVVSDTVANDIRVIIFYDRQANGAACVSGDVLNTSTVFATYNTNQVIGAGGTRIKIVYDWTYAINPAGTIRHEVAKKFIKNAKAIARYTGTAGTVSDILENNLQVLVIAGAATGGLTCYSVIHYTDA